MEKKKTNRENFPYGGLKLGRHSQCGVASDCDLSCTRLYKQWLDSIRI